MSTGRANKVFLVFFSILAVLFLRFAYLQLWQANKLSKAAAVQRLASLKVEKPRGNILDRNGIPFTNRNVQMSVVLKPFLLKEKTAQIKQIAGVLGVDPVSLQDSVKNKIEPIVFRADKDYRKPLTELNIPGVSFLYSLQRYDSQTLAKHILGYLNKIDQTGETGIEKIFESTLKDNGTKKVGVITDARSHMVEGMGYRMVKPVENDEELNLRLTLDYHIQKIVEECMKKNGMKGAVIVEDISSGDLLAVASKPDYDPNRVEDFLQSPDNALFNRSVASYNLGSVFKIIVAAQTLESRVYSAQRFYCEGYTTIGDKIFRCSSYEIGGHGSLDMKEAFSLSCNSSFIQLGLKLGSKGILSMAEKFGLGRETGLSSQGIDETTGKLPSLGNTLSDGDIANISIGQGGIMATPLQVTSIVSTVASGGNRKKLNILDAVVDDDGRKVRNLKQSGEVRVISTETSERLKAMMEEVTLHGTGTLARLEGIGGSAGKTGSAETGQVHKGEKVVHGWFAGYFPVNKPRYAVTVFVEDGKSGGQVAAPVFAEIARVMIEKGY